MKTLLTDLVGLVGLGCLAAGLYINLAQDRP